MADDINSFIDDTMDFDLNEKDDKGTKYLINEVSAKINFISGKLAGQQFELAKREDTTMQQKGLRSFHLRTTGG